MTNPEAASYGRALELIRPTGASLETVADTFAVAFGKLGGNHIVEAVNFYQQHRADLITRKTVAEVVNEMIEVKTKRVKKGKGASERYLGDLRNRLDRFALAFAVDISSVTQADVQGWLDKLDLAAQSVKNYQTVIGTLFTFAESRGYIAKNCNPLADMEIIEANTGAIQIYTPEEIDKLLKSASKELLPALALGAFAGIRTAEILRLDWSNIDMAGGLVHVAAEKAKTASRRLVPILPNLAQWLAPYARCKGPIWNGDEIEMSKSRAEATKAAGVAWKDNGLRHSFISYRLADVQSAAQVALEAGNSPAVVFKHYRELVKPPAAKAWFAVAPKQPENVVQMKQEATQ